MGAAHSDEIAVGRVRIGATAECTKLLHVALVPHTKRFFDSPDNPNFVALHEIYTADKRVVEWFGPSMQKRTREEYWQVLVDSAEHALRARDSTKLPLPVVVLTREVWYHHTPVVRVPAHGQHQAPVNDAPVTVHKWQVTGYFGCRRFSDAAESHTLGIFLRQTPVPIGSFVVQLACAAYHAQRSKYTMDDDAETLCPWPQRVTFTTKVGNAKVYAMLRCALGAFPALADALQFSDEDSAAQSTTSVSSESSRSASVSAAGTSSDTYGERCHFRISEPGAIRGVCESLVTTTTPGDAAPADDADLTAFLWGKEHNRLETIRFELTCAPSDPRSDTTSFLHRDPRWAFLMAKTPKP